MRACATPDREGRAPALPALRSPVPALRLLVALLAVRVAMLLREPVLLRVAVREPATVPVWEPVLLRVAMRMQAAPSLPAATLAPALLRTP